MTHVNHEVSRAIMAEALACNAGVIAMERLTHIRQQSRAGKRVRTRLHRWAWGQPQSLVPYKAQGLAVAFVNPAFVRKPARTAASGRHVEGTVCVVRVKTGRMRMSTPHPTWGPVGGDRRPRQGRCKPSRCGSRLG